jgi:CBS domain-containing protein
MRDIVSVPFGDVSERLARLAGLALRRDGVDIERVLTISSGKPVYAGADATVADVERALRSKDVRLLPVLDGVHLLGFVDVSVLPRFARELHRGASNEAS